MMVLSSAETTQAEITKEMTLLFESSGQASIELVDSGCDIVKAALHSIEVFLMGSMIPATSSTTTNNRIMDVQRCNHIIEAFINYFNSYFI
mmetsp:Transcript_51610/g.57651  ORF Transcript_51610/g.57651 Transcript_51610/m.57651 type:complete len:91 (-) Transcript_51610:121-393(-)